MNMIGATNAVLSVVSAQPSDAGSYSVLVANAAGTAASSTAGLPRRPRILVFASFNLEPIESRDEFNKNTKFAVVASQQDQLALGFAAIGQKPDARGCGRVAD